MVSRQEASELAQNKPLSFLHISRPEIDLPEVTNPYDDQVYDQGKKRLEEMRAQGNLLQDKQKQYYLYQMQDGAHIQTGLVALASVEKYNQNQIVKHELTRKEKETDRIRMIDGMNAQASPVLLACPASPKFREIIAPVLQTTAENEIKDERGVVHRLWLAGDPAVMRELDQLFNQGGFQKLYIADGHHRSAAASQIAARRKAANPNHRGQESYNYFLSVIFPADEMKILDYNRAITDLNGMTPGAFLQALEPAFQVAAAKAVERPAHPQEMILYLAGQWYQLKVKKEKIPRDPTASLDVSLLYDLILAPILGIGNPRTDKRIDFIGGIRGLEELKKRVDTGEFALAFGMHPTKMEQIMQVADADEIMPPKSTWFEPKLVDGLVSHLL